MATLSDLNKERKDAIRLHCYHRIKRGTINRQFGVQDFFYKKLDKSVIS